jgi:hypothetical protein
MPRSAPRSAGRRSRSDCPVPVRPSRSSWKPTRGHYGISSAGARSSSFLQAAPLRVPGTTRARRGRAADARVSVAGVTARLEFRSHESNCHRWVMSKPSAVATRPGLSLTPMLASAYDAIQSGPVSPRLARPEVSRSQSRSQDHSREWRLRHVPGRSLRPLTRTGRFAAGTAVARPRASGRSGTGSRSPVSRPSSA